MSSFNNKITPDGPLMRSVMILSQESSLAIPAPRSFISKAAPFQVVQSSCSGTSAQPSTWTPRTVHPLPEVYPLERSHVYVEDASANQVARRMADCLRMESVAVQYEDSLARCDTCEHVKFNIRLFTSGKKIVVEIQRVSGCCFLFHQATKNILRAALGQEAQPSVILTVPPCVMSELEEEDATEEALFFALNMLQSPRFDCNVLAMESLASVTKANSVAAKSVVNGPLMTLILGWVEGQNAEDQDFHDQEHSVKMHRYALVILANCLTALSPTDTPKVSDDCLKILIGELKAACERPHDACEAAKSLKALVRSSDVRLRALAMGAPSALMGAYQLGKSQHHQLERESLSLQMEMGN